MSVFKYSPEFLHVWLIHVFPAGTPDGLRMFLPRETWLSFMASSCVVDLVLVLRGGAVRGHFSADGRRDAAAVLVVVGQRQVQQAGAGGQVDVLHVLHLRPTHRTHLRERKGKVFRSGLILFF